MAITYPLTKFGASLYATSTGLIGGDRYICTIEGLDAFKVTDQVNVVRALSNKAYIQYQAILDMPVSITYPLMDTTTGASIIAVVQAAITGLTTFALDITGDAGTFTFTAKPAENPISFEQSIISGMWSNFTVRANCTD
jgi:hypothetical protein